MTQSNDQTTSQETHEFGISEAMAAIDGFRNQQTRLAEQMRQTTRRARMGGAVALAITTGAIALAALKPVSAQGYGPTLTSLQNQITALTARVTTLENKTHFLSANVAAKTSTFSGCNVLIQSGSGFTSDNTALGNLIIGYNEDPLFGSNTRTGAHNLILGEFNSYSSYGGIVAGDGNDISAPFASVTGGSANAASASNASVTGGFSNTASEFCASVSGGHDNTATGSYSAVSGGQLSNANGNSSAVSGGYKNLAGGTSSSATGGANNAANGNFSWIGGGSANNASNFYAAISGGSSNTASGEWSSVCGGFLNNAAGNNANGDYDTILGGFGITISAQYSHSP